MRDRVFYPLAALAAIGMIALSLAWPKGESPSQPAAPPAKAAVR